jgi:CRISPR-associated endonuclease Csn1
MELSKTIYADILTTIVYTKNFKDKVCKIPGNVFLATKIYTAENKGTRDEKKNYKHIFGEAKHIRAITYIEDSSFLITEINNNLNQSSGYLGAISDRSKELYFNKQTVGSIYMHKFKKLSYSS